MLILNEASRNELVSQAKRGEREKGDGKTRFEKRLKSRLSSSVREYNELDMNSLFKDNIININIPVKGETDNYIVKISYGGFLDILREQLEKNNDVLDLRIVIRSLIIGFNKGDVYISCSCPDFFFRFGYWATINKINSGEAQLIPSDETNPNDKLGPGCKHILLALANTSWLVKVASVIRNYIQYMEKNRQQLYQNIIYPAIYGKEYTEPVQQSMFDDEEELGDKSTIDIANIEARKKGQFKPGNIYRYQKQNVSDDQISMEDEEQVGAEDEQ